MQNKHKYTKLYSAIWI